MSAYEDNKNSKTKKARVPYNFLTPIKTEHNEDFEYNYDDVPFKDLAMYEDDGRFYEKYPRHIRTLCSLFEEFATAPFTKTVEIDGYRLSGYLYNHHIEDFGYIAIEDQKEDFDFDAKAEIVYGVEEGTNKGFIYLTDGYKSPTDVTFYKDYVRCNAKENVRVENGKLYAKEAFKYRTFDLCMFFMRFESDIYTAIRDEFGVHLEERLVEQVEKEPKQGGVSLGTLVGDLWLDNPPTAILNALEVSLRGCRWDYDYIIDSAVPRKQSYADRFKVKFMKEKRTFDEAVDDLLLLDGLRGVCLGIIDALKDVVWED